MLYVEMTLFLLHWELYTANLTCEGEMGTAGDTLWFLHRAELIILDNVSPKASKHSSIWFVMEFQVNWNTYICFGAS